MLERLDASICIGSVLASISSCMVHTKIFDLVFFADEAATKESKVNIFWERQQIVTEFNCPREEVQLEI